jgi:acetyltransferase
MTLTPFFNPKSVAVIGASNDRNKVGYALVSNLVNGTKRDIYPVTISEKEVLGLKAYASIKDVPADIDLVLIAVRADIVPSIMEECAAKKVKAVTIIAAGFKEIGPAGAELEKKCAEIAEKNGIALLGPNCLGTIDTHSSFNASFAPIQPKTGHIAFLSQSGALGTAILDKALSEGIGFSKFVSLGNEADLSEIEFLECLKDDDDTRAILMYVEQLRDGRRFMELATEITAHKPIVVIKAGRSARGALAVMSHTGSLASEDSVFTAACKQSGIIVVGSIREFFNMAKLFELDITKPLQKLIVLTNAGGPAVVTSDLIDLSKSLSLVELKEETKDALRKVLPPMAAFGNPIDIIGDALAARYENALKILVEVKEADAIVTLLTPQMMTETEATAKLLAEYNEKKPIIPVFLGGPTIEKGLMELKNDGLVNFSFPKDAIEALDNMARGADKYNTVVNKKGNVIKVEAMMPYEGMRQMFKENGLELPGILVKERSGLAEALKNISNGPYTLKAMSPDIVHKTDMGAVQLHLQSLADVEKAWDEITTNVQSKNPQAVIEGMLVQTMLPGKEVIIGMKRDSVFGPTILFGLGGIFTEALKDTSLRIAPVSKEEADKMIHEIRGINILSGLRGESSVDFSALADIIVNLSKMVMEHPEIKEIDMNPVIATSEGAAIVDARVMI